MNEASLKSQSKIVCREHQTHFPHLLNIRLSSLTLLPRSLVSSLSVSLKSDGQTVAGTPSLISLGLPLTTCLTVRLGACWSCWCAAEQVLCAGSGFFKRSKCWICFSSAICSHNMKGYW